MENVAGLDVTLTPDDLARLEIAAASLGDAAAGERNPEAYMRLVDR